VKTANDETIESEDMKEQKEKIDANSYGEPAWVDSMGGHFDPVALTMGGLQSGQDEEGMLRSEHVLINPDGTLSVVAASAAVKDVSQKASQAAQQLALEAERAAKRAEERVIAANKAVATSANRYTQRAETAAKNAVSRASLAVQKANASVEAAIKSELLDQTIEAIEKSASTGKIGDGKIFVFDLEQVVRIRTGESGTDAL
jgi:nitrogen regulatory protein PII